VKMFSSPPQAGAGSTFTLTLSSGTPALTSKPVMLSLDYSRERNLVLFAL
jgi:hypothetical protein